MVALVYGGAASGKSEYAETLSLELAKKSADAKLYYLATMIAYGEEGEYRVNRHRSLRAGKGFNTVEQSTEIEEALKQIEKSNSSVVLLEDLSNLVANEMYVTDEDGNFITRSPEEVVAKIIGGLEALAKQCESLVIVSTNIFEDGCDYDESTRAFVLALGELHQRISSFANRIVEVVVGIPLEKK